MAASQFTLGDLIFEASIMAGLADPRDGQLAPEDANYGYSKLYSLIDKLTISRLALFRRQRTGPFNVTAGMGNVTSSPPTPITIGPGGQFDTARPVWIDRAGLIYTAGSVPNPEERLRILTTEEWSRIAVKGTTATLSSALFYDQTIAGGLGSIYLYPVPSAAFQVVLYSPQPISEVPYDANGNPEFDIVLSVPPGYRPMLITNLACILCIGVLPISADLREEAVSSMALVKASNLVQTMDALTCDPAVIGRDVGIASPTFDWLTGGIS